jgi:2-polyprenyl-3-methyl-5-hydroxy-6-metoxy-1,4-benzoquinol methylase
MLQDKDALEILYLKHDPWGYENSPDDLRRRGELLGLISGLRPRRTLDIGCGDGFITFALPGAQVIGVDISENAIGLAQSIQQNRLDSARFLFIPSSIFDFSELFPAHSFDLIVITGVLYDQYIGNAKSVVRTLIDRLLVPSGILVCCHIEDWYRPFFCYTTIDQVRYPYRNYTHLLEVNKK